MSHAEISSTDNKCWGELGLLPTPQNRTAEHLLIISSRKSLRGLQNIGLDKINAIIRIWHQVKVDSLPSHIFGLDCQLSVLTKLHNLN